MNDLFKLSFNNPTTGIYYLSVIIINNLFNKRFVYYKKDIYLSLNPHKRVLNKLVINFQIYL